MLCVCVCVLSTLLCTVQYLYNNIIIHISICSLWAFGGSCQKLFHLIITQLFTASCSCCTVSVGLGGGKCHTYIHTYVHTYPEVTCPNNIIIIIIFDDLCHRNNGIINPYICTDTNFTFIRNNTYPYILHTS